MIADILGVGEKNAKTASDIQAIIGGGIKKREVQKIVRQERLEGALICASGKGYFMPETMADVKSTILSLYSMSKETKAVADKMKEGMSHGIGAEEGMMGNE
jgi:hypothetical protein